MATDYAALANTAQKLLNNFGNAAKVTVRRVTGDTYDPATGTSSGTTEETSDYAVFLPATGGKIQALDVRYADAALIEQNLQYVLISAVDLLFKPEPGDSIIDPQSNVWEVIGTTPINVTSGDPVLYKTAIRR